jgi:hypothetical protein
MRGASLTEGSGKSEFLIAAARNSASYEKAVLDHAGRACGATSASNPIPCAHRANLSLKMKKT